ncbi:MAG: DNA-binding protein WhiA [Lachnospiraceae bacterium]|nr:DNA-binding protein WhiA [Lachnospiraceae bacterium]
MSFSSEVKEELCRKVLSARHCQIGEITAILFLCGKVSIDENDQYSLIVQTENVAVARKYYQLVKAAFGAVPSIMIRRNEYLKKSRIYKVTVSEHKDAIRILKAAKMMDEDGILADALDIRNHTVLQRTCCKRAFIRGAFLAAGSLSDPEKNYHFEIVSNREEKARQIQTVMNEFNLDAKMTTRKKYYVIYLKESSSIVDVLNVMEAPLALMHLENVRILKDMRNTVNRRVNCEAANINKTVTAAARQIDDIRFIEAEGGFGDLSPGLLETARLRLEYPDVPLKELGTMLNPPVGKSGVNHRLRKLSEIAQKLREKDTM